MDPVEPGLPGSEQGRSNQPPRIPMVTLAVRKTSTATVEPSDTVVPPMGTIDNVTGGCWAAPGVDAANNTATARPIQFFLGIILTSTGAPKPRLGYVISRFAVGSTEPIETPPPRQVQMVGIQTLSRACGRHQSCKGLESMVERSPTAKLRPAPRRVVGLELLEGFAVGEFVGFGHAVDDESPVEVVDFMLPNAGQ